MLLDLAYDSDDDEIRSAVHEALAIAGQLDEDEEWIDDEPPI